MDALRLEIGEGRDDAIDNQITQGLNATVPDGLAKHDPVALTLVLRNGDGAVEGALVGERVWDWLYIKYLWVDQARQGQGQGARLIRAVEAEAERQGLSGIWVNTFSFQAPGFYEKLGYQTFGELDGFPKGYALRYYQKRLDRAQA